MTTNPLHDQVAEIEDNIASRKAEIKKTRHQSTLCLMGAIAIICVSIVGIYLSIKYSNLIFVTYKNPNDSMNNGYLFLFFVFGFGEFFGIPTAITLVWYVISNLTSITSLKAEIDIWETRKRVISQFAASNEKPSYFDSLVRINIENLAAYYSLVKSHTGNSFKLAVWICILGFVLIAVGLIVGFIDLNHFNMITYVSSGVGVIIEAISSIFFSLYNRTVRQMKEYHDSLLTVQNILLSFKLVEDTHDESEKAKIVSQMLAYLINKQSASPLTSDLDASVNQSQGRGNSKN